MLDALSSCLGMTCFGFFILYFLYVTWEFLVLPRVPGPTRTATKLIEAAPSEIWDIITNPTEFPGFLKGGFAYEWFDRSTAYSGFRFSRVYMHSKSGPSDYYIVNWLPNTRFSMGPENTRWNYDFQLTPLNGKTELRYSKRFHGKGWFRFGQEDVEHSVEKIAEMIERKKA